MIATLISLAMISQASTLVPVVHNPRVGDTLTAYRRISGQLQPVYGVALQSDFEPLAKTFNSGDKEGFEQMFAAKKLTSLSSGTSVKVLAIHESLTQSLANERLSQAEKRTPFYFEVRIMDGPSSGQKIYMMWDHVRKCEVIAPPTPKKGRK